MPFFPRILVHLVRLDDGVIQRVAVQPEPGVVLEPVPQFQEMLAVAAQLAGELGGGLALGDAPEDQEDPGGAAMGPLEEGPGPGIEDAAAVAALVIQDRGPVAVVDPEPLPLPAAGAGQSLGVEQLDELAVAGVLVHGVVQGEVHRWALRATRCISYEPNPFRTSRQGAEHGIGPMSLSDLSTYGPQACRVPFGPEVRRAGRPR